MMHQFAHWLIHVHDWLGWFGPALLAVYTGVLPWVLWYPMRYIDHLPSSPAPLGKQGAKSVPRFCAGWSLPFWYGLWFAMPHVGTEILVMIVTIPFAALYLFFVVGVTVLDALDNPGDYFDTPKRKSMGLSIAEWEIMKYEEKRRREEAEHKAIEEREASFRGADIRKDRFRVFDGTRGDGR